MSKIFILIMMVFCHVVDDYYLQGWLASAKQKEYWQKNAPQEMYKYDYIWALIMHSFSWAFMIMLPVAYYYSFDVGVRFAIGFMVNIIIHAIIDDLKANKKVINLWVDQLIHISQIVMTAMILIPKENLNNG